MNYDKDETMILATDLKTDDDFQKISSLLDEILALAKEKRNRDLLTAARLQANRIK